MMKLYLYFFRGGEDWGGIITELDFFRGSFLYILGLFLKANVQKLNILGGAKF